MPCQERGSKDDASRNVADTNASEKLGVDGAHPRCALLQQEEPGGFVSAFKGCPMLFTTSLPIMLYNIPAVAGSGYRTQ